MRARRSFRSPERVCLAFSTSGRTDSNLGSPRVSSHTIPPRAAARVPAMAAALPPPGVGVPAPRRSTNSDTFRSTSIFCLLLPLQKNRHISRYVLHSLPVKTPPRRVLRSYRVAMSPFIHHDSLLDHALHVIHSEVVHQMR